MIISAFPFLNELDLLEYRLKTMSPMVDMFVLMESPVTFSGKPKPLYYEQNKDRFAQWNIHHLVVEERPDDVLWEREKHQRAMLLAEVDKLAPEIAIFSDCDEFVAPDVVDRFIASGHEMMRLELDMLTFYADRKDSLEWIQGCIMRWRLGLLPELRGGESPVLPKAGWHFEYIGHRELLLEKVSAVSQGPEASGQDIHQKVSLGDRPALERTSPYPIEKLPVPMQEDIATLVQKGWVKNRFATRLRPKTDQRSAFTIVFNGDFCLEQCIENVLPLVDRMVVVEGATERMAKIAPNRTSTDGTNEILDRLAKRHPNLRVVHGSWRDKTEMCNAALEFLNPGLIWQIDADEFYHQEEMDRVMNFMDANPEFTDAEFWGYHFFGGFTHHTQMKPSLWGNDPPWRRLFRWCGEQWVTHAPPRLERSEEVLTRERTADLCKLYHYGYCWHRQVLEKLIYHGNTFQARQLEEFEKQARGDFRKTKEDFAGKRPSLVEFAGTHPVDVKGWL